MTLRDVKVGESAKIAAVGGEGAQRAHLLAMGVTPGASVTVVKYAPMGDPVEVELRGYELTLRLADAQLIEVEQVGEHRHCEPLQSKGAAVSIQWFDTRRRWRRTHQPFLLRKNHSTTRVVECRPLADGTQPPRAAQGGKIAMTEKNEIASRARKRVEIAMTDSEHPGLGEEGRYHTEGAKGAGEPIPRGAPLRFALLGNQNCGKTTLFNALTGSSQHVGNFPGVTVDRKDGDIRGVAGAVVTDLPGIYSLSTYSQEERVARNFILDEKPQGIINIVDATNVERNLNLSMQVMETGIPMVIALNMMDEVRGNGGAIRVNALEAALGVPVVPISAAKGEGIDELVRHAVHVARHKEGPAVTDYCSKDEDGGAVHRCLHGIMHLIADHAEDAALNARFAASRLVEGDEEVAARLKLDENETEAIEHIIVQMEAERKLDRAAAMADMRYDFIDRVCKKTVVRPHESRERRRSEAIDKVLTGKWTAIPCFIAIMAAVFFLTFSVIGAAGQALLEMAIDKITYLLDAAMTAGGVNDVVRSLVTDGIMGGVGGVISFLPIIVTLFFFLSLLEDSGYMARIAFVMDRALRKIGLSGRSIVPMLVGFGCTVPAVMAARTLPSDRDRKMTILLTPFMSCPAKLPIYAMLAAAFFPGQGAVVMLSLYLGGVVLAVLAAVLFRLLHFKGEASPFVMELPNYRAPGLVNVAHLLWEKTKDFVSRACTVILAATIVVWFMQTFGTKLDVVADSSKSLLAHLSAFIVPAFSPLGFGDWRIVSSLITGFMAKESVVATTTVLFGSTQAMAQVMTQAGAAALLVFCLLYTPCVAAISVIKREMGFRWAAFVVIGQCAIAWVAALAVHFVMAAAG